MTLKEQLHAVIDSMELASASDPKSMPSVSSARRC